MQRISVAVAVVALALLVAQTAGASHGSQLASQRTKPCSHHGMKAADTADSALLSARPSTARRLLQKKYQLSPDPDNKGCYLYRAQSRETIDDIAKDLGVSAAEMREQNKKNIADFSRLSGRFVEICGVTNFENAEGVGGGPINPGTRLSAANAPPAPAPAPVPPPAPAATPAPAPAPAPAPKPGQTTTTTTQTTTTTTGSPPAAGTSSSLPIRVGTGGGPLVGGIPFIGRRRL